MVIRMLLPDQEATCGVSAVSFMVFLQKKKKKDFLFPYYVGCREECENN